MLLETDVCLRLLWFQFALKPFRLIIKSFISRQDFSRDSSAGWVILRIYQSRKEPFIQFGAGKNDHDMKCRKRCKISGHTQPSAITMSKQVTILCSFSTVFMIFNCIAVRRNSISILTPISK